MFARKSQIMKLKCGPQRNCGQELTPKSCLVYGGHCGSRILSHELYTSETANTTHFLACFKTMSLPTTDTLAKCLYNALTLLAWTIACRVPVQQPAPYVESHHLDDITRSSVPSARRDRMAICHTKCCSCPVQFDACSTHLSLTQLPLKAQYHFQETTPRCGLIASQGIPSFLSS